MFFGRGGRRRGGDDRALRLQPGQQQRLARDIRFQAFDVVLEISRLLVQRGLGLRTREAGQLGQPQVEAKCLPEFTLSSLIYVPVGRNDQDRAGSYEMFPGYYN